MNARARTLVRGFETAAMNLAWKGGADPSDHEAIEREYDLAYTALASYIEALERCVGVEPIHMVVDAVPVGCAYTLIVREGSCEALLRPEGA